MRKKTLAKILSIIFVLVAVCACCVAFAVSAAGLSANVNDETAYRGQTVTFNATLSESVTVGSGSLALSYDSNVLELIDGSCNVSGAMLSNFDVSKGKGAFAFSGTGTVSGDLFTVTFRVKDTAAFGTTNVSMDVTLKDGSNAVISLTNNNGSITVNCNHSFTREDTAYPKSAATCTSPALYYKSCEICGAKGTETFEYGTAEKHSYTREVITDTYKKSNASCKAKAVYYYCCATCTAKGTDADIFEYGTELDHSYTRQVITDAYKKSNADCDSKAVYYYCCATCDAKDTPTFEYGSVLGHTGGTATCTEKAVCTRCTQPYGGILGHIDVALKDHICDRSCGKTDMGVHSDGNDANHTCDYCGGVVDGDVCVDVAPKNHICDECRTTLSNCEEGTIIDGKCDYCGNPVDHTHIDMNKDHVCDYDNCTANDGTHSDSDDANHTCDYCNGAVEGDICVDAAPKDHVCDECGATNMGDHSDSVTDQDHLCDYGCGATLEDCVDSETDPDHLCDVCGETASEHAYSTEWSKSTTHHWHECNCGDKADESTHVFGEWTITDEATATEDGEKTRACVCGQTATETIPATGADDSVDGGKGLSGGAVAGIAVGFTAVVGVGGFSLFWFVIKKKRWADLLKIFKK